MTPRALLPRDPTAIAWWVSPLAAALVMVPEPATVALCGVVLSVFVAVHAARTSLLVTAAAASLVGVLALGLGWAPAEVGGLLVGLGGAAFVQRLDPPQPRRTMREITDMVVLTSLGVAVMVRAGGPTDVAGATGFALLAWHTSGWWTVRSQLSRADHGAEIPKWIVWVPSVLLPACLLACNGVGFPWVGLVPFGFPVRAMAHDALRTPDDLPRVALQDTLWSSAAAMGMVLLAGL